MNYIIEYFIFGLLWALIAEKMSIKFNKQQLKTDNELSELEWGWLLRIYFIVLWPATLITFISELIKQSNNTPNGPATT